MEDNKQPPNDQSVASGESPAPTVEGSLEMGDQSTPETINSSSVIATPSTNDQTKATKRFAPKQVFGHFKNSRNLYLFIFIFLIAVAGGAAFMATRLQNHSSNKGKSPSSLSPEELSQLKGSTTLVGDAKQTLDIQGNAIFEGQVLVRSDLNVAGSTKVGGALSAASLTISGDVSFGQLQLNNNLSVSGNAAVTGSLTAQKGLAVTGNGSFSGSLSASQLNVGTLNMTGDIILSRHISLGGPVPGKTDGTALGGGGTVSVNGSDTAGTININTGSSPPAGSFVTVNFAVRFSATPHVVVSPVGSAAASLQFYVTRSTSGFTLFTANAPPAGSSFSFDYVVID